MWSLWCTSCLNARKLWLCFWELTLLLVRRQTDSLPIALLLLAAWVLLSM